MNDLFSILAVYMITLIVNKYDGPFGIVERFRASLKGEAMKLVECYVCLSVFVAIPFAINSDLPFLIAWFGFSGGAVILHEVWL